MKKFMILKIFNWLFGILFFLIGVVNFFWGNDRFFGFFIVVLSFVYLPPVSVWLKKFAEPNTLKFLKVGLAIFILWAALGVGELFDKIELMINDLF